MQAGRSASKPATLADQRIITGMPHLPLGMKLEAEELEESAGGECCTVMPVANAGVELCTQRADAGGECCTAMPALSYAHKELMLEGGAGVGAPGFVDCKTLSRAYGACDLRPERPCHTSREGPKDLSDPRCKVAESAALCA
eukprot:1159928-Pelagomonas_calceolata.AAC.4